MPDGGFVVAGQLDLPEFYFRSNIQATGSVSGAALVLLCGGRHHHLAAIDSPGERHRTPQARATISGPSAAFTRCSPTARATSSSPAQRGIRTTSRTRLSSRNSTQAVRSSGSTVFQGPIDARTEFRAALTRDGGVLLSSQHDVSGSGALTDPAVAKLNGDGSLAFYAAYDQGHIQYLDTAAVCESATENNIYVAVVTNGGGAVTLLRIDGSGNLLSVHDTRNGGVTRQEVPIAIGPSPELYPFNISSRYNIPINNIF